MATTVILKGSTAVSGAVAASGTTGTIYTCPANSFAICNFYMTGGTLPLCSVGGVPASAGATVGVSQLYVGPGQSVVISDGGAAPTSVGLSGVQYTNT